MGKVKTALDKQIERSYYRIADGVQIPIMAIPDIFRDARKAIANGEDLDTAMLWIVREYRVGGRDL